MNRYVLKFSKLGYTKYISHLDLLRVFKRTFKVAGLSIRYSNGFNPHPKMGFAQPLSLGYSSTAEYLEFETDMTYNAADLKKRLRSLLPEDIEITEILLLDPESRSLAAETLASGYEITFPLAEDEDELKKMLKAYMSQKQITAVKRIKKTNTDGEVSIRDKIRSLDISSDGDRAVMHALLDSGSSSNLSPELVIQSFVRFIKRDIKRWEVEVRRTDIFFSDRIQFRHIDNTP